jgi:RHS repeat-associated protein
VQSNYAYDPYGSVTATGAASTNSFQYTGQMNDGTGLYYYKNRYYSPRLARFVSEDPIGLDGGQNPYAYVGGNPISLTDPIGLAPFYNNTNRDIVVGGGPGKGLGHGGNDFITAIVPPGGRIDRNHPSENGLYDVDVVDLNGDGRVEAPQSNADLYTNGKGGEKIPGLDIGPICEVIDLQNGKGLQVIWRGFVVPGYSSPAPPPAIRDWSFIYRGFRH